MISMVSNAFEECHSVIQVETTLKTRNPVNTENPPQPMLNFASCPPYMTVEHSSGVDYICAIA